MALNINTEIINVIKGQMLALVNNDATYQNYNVKVYDEQTFDPLKAKIKAKDIYVGIRMGAGTIYAGSITVPAFFEIISEEDSLIVAKNLMIEYGLTYNLVTPLTGLTSANVFLQQAYTTPQTQSNFNELNGGYRSLIVLNATFVIGENINSINDLQIDGESINFISCDTTNTATPNTVDTGINFSRTESAIKFSTFAMTLTMVSKSNSAFIAKVDILAYGTASYNKTIFVVRFNKNGVIYTKNLHLLTPDFKQTKGMIPTYTISFVE